MATLAQIAREAKVSVKTVSNVLNADRLVLRGDAVRRAERIRQIAERMGYRPNTAARAVRQGSFGAVGILQAADPGAGRMPSEALLAIQRQLSERDMHLSMGIVPDFDLSDPAGLPKVLREWCVDGLLVSYTADPPPLVLDHIKQYQIPAIWMNIKLSHDCVHLDDLGGARGATEALLEQGHQRILFLGLNPHSSHYSTGDRYDGYALAMQRAGLKPNPLFKGAETFGDATRSQQMMHQLIEILASPDRPTGIVTTLDMAEVMFAAHLAGLQVPRDLSLVGLNDGHGNVLGRMPTRMRLHTYGLGWRAFDQLHQKIQAPAEPLEPVAVFCSFERGQTLGPVPLLANR